MIEIKKIISLSGKKKNLQEIEDNFYERVIKYSNPFKKLSDERIGSFLKRKVNAYESRILHFFRKNEKDFITAKPEKLDRIVNFVLKKNKLKNVFINNDKASNFSKAIEKTLNYKGFRVAKSKGIWLAETLNIKVCPYCNNQYTFVIKTGENKKAKFQFDHFYPKSIFPFLSLSLYNLIPSCANCNLSKKDTYFKLSENFHPYSNSIADKFQFTLTSESEKKILLNNNTNPDEIEIEITNKDKTIVKNYNKAFDIEHIYQRHKDILQEIYLKAKMYPPSRKRELLKLCDDDKKPLFENEDYLDRIILGNYSLESEINKRPLSKFTQDIAKQARLTKRHVDIFGS